MQWGRKGRSNWLLDLLFNHRATLLTAAFLFPLDHFQSIIFLSGNTVYGSSFSLQSMTHFPVQCVILVSQTFYCFYHTEVFRCVARAPKQQHFQKQMRVLAALSALENSLYYLFQFLLEQILSGFATGLRFTCFSVTNICFLIFGQRLIFKISIYFECLANITQLCLLGWAQIICTTP